MKEIEKCEYLLKNYLFYDSELGMKKVWSLTSEHKLSCEIELQINNGSFFSISIYINGIGIFGGLFILKTVHCLSKIEIELDILYSINILKEARDFHLAGSPGFQSWVRSQSL